MTRVTAFGFPKKGNTASTWDELTGRATGDESAQAESSGNAQRRKGGEENDGGYKKRKRKDERGEEGNANGRTGGWGKNDDIKRELVCHPRNSESRADHFSYRLLDYQARPNGPNNVVLDGSRTRTLPPSVSPVVPRATPPGNVPMSSWLLSRPSWRVRPQRMRPRGV